MFCFSLPAIAQQADWKLKKEKNGIRIFFRETAGSDIKEVKVLARAQTSLSSIVACISDVDNFTSWMDHYLESKKIKSYSDSEYIYYVLTNFPWPMSDREVIMHCTIHQDPATRTVYFQAEAEPDFIPPNDKYMRLRQTTSKWKITPEKDGFLQLEYYLKSDPGGAIPAWMVNAGLEAGPMKAMKNLIEIVRSDRYRSQQLAQIREPDRR